MKTIDFPNINLPKQGTFCFWKVDNTDIYYLLSNGQVTKKCADPNLGPCNRYILGTPGKDKACVQGLYFGVYI